MTCQKFVKPGGGRGKPSRSSHCADCGIVWTLHWPRGASPQAAKPIKQPRRNPLRPVKRNSMRPVRRVMRKASARVIAPTIKASTFGAPKPEPKPIIVPPKPQPMPCGHLPDELASSDEGTSFCRGCERRTKLAATFDRISLEQIARAHSGKSQAEIQAIYDAESEWW